MYKYLLCWRYLRTRYIALASIISVMLGVATMIVVNAVMAGFAGKMQDRIHGALSDIIVECQSLDGFADYERVMARIEGVAAGRVVAMAPAVEVPGMASIPFPNGEPLTQPVKIIGIRAEDRAKLGSFREYIVDDSPTPKTIPPTYKVSDELKLRGPRGNFLREEAAINGGNDGFDNDLRRELLADAGADGAILGHALATWHDRRSHRDIFLAPMGNSINLTFPSAGKRIEARVGSFVATGYYKSGMSEYDSSNVYIDLAAMQHLRGAHDRQNRPKVNQVLIRATPGADLDRLSESIRSALDPLYTVPGFFRVSTWEQKQGSILAAVQVEQSILNILLFFIIAVAGFGILAIFSMIVVEKTRDIGILKALGASTSGVRSIFLGYGLLLGLVGSGVGMAGGLLFVRYINVIETWLSKVTGRRVFDDTIYYFDSIPTEVDPATVAWIVGGALFIAVAASVWPAHRASSLHPVRALRYE